MGEFLYAVWTMMEFIRWEMFMTNQYTIYGTEKSISYTEKNIKNNQIELCTHCIGFRGSVITHIRKGRVIYDKIVKKNA